MGAQECDVLITGTVRRVLARPAANAPAKRLNAATKSDTPTNHPPTRVAEIDHLGEFDTQQRQMQNSLIIVVNSRDILATLWSEGLSQCSRRQLDPAAICSMKIERARAETPSKERLELVGIK
jgi:hypothetical protein